MNLDALVSIASAVLEVAGVAIVVLGSALASFQFIRRPERHGSRYRQFREDLGRAILLGLEFFVGADIIRTVSTVPTLSDLAVLGGIVIVRTFLSFTLQVELEGRWPWQPVRPMPQDLARQTNGEDGEHPRVVQQVTLFGPRA